MDQKLLRDQPPKMSGPSANRLQQQRSKFTADVIKAIEELEIHKRNRSSQQLADAAWHKLQYDLPVLEVTELQALLDSLRVSLQGKASWPCYILSSKALDNITGGAKRSTTFHTVLSEDEQQLHQMLDEAISNAISNKCAHSNASQKAKGSSSHGAAHQQQQQVNPTPQSLYQQLCAVLLLQYMAKVASLPEQDAWQLLLEYEPELTEQHCRAQTPAAWQQQLGQPEGDDSALLAALTMVDSQAGQAASAARQESRCTQTASTTVYDVQEAAVQDEDDETYEALELLHAPAAPSNRGSSRQHPHSEAAEQQQQHYTWPALRRKLISIAEQVHYSLLSYEPLWQRHQAAQHLLQLLRSLGVHSHAGELQPVLHAYVSLLVDRLAAAPADLPLLQQLWEALGLTGDMSSRGYRSPGQRQQQALPSEVVLGFSVAASIWGQLPGTSARAKLWHLMYDNLLPVLEQSTEQLAYSTVCNNVSSSGQQGNRSRSNGIQAEQGNQQQQQQPSAGESFAHVLLLSYIVELLVLGRQGATDVAGQLTQCGVMRNITVLFGQHAANSAAEPLRRAVLLASCSSQEAASWVLAVPAVGQQLQQPVFQPNGAAEAHGAVWQLLIARNKHSQAASQPFTQLLTLLELDSGNVAHLQRHVALLQLLVDVQKAAGRMQLWGQQVQTALKQLASSIKAQQGCAADASETDAGVVEAAAVGSSGDTCDLELQAGSSELDDEGKGAKAIRRQQQQQHMADTSSASQDITELGRKHCQQLQPAALRLIKQLLTSGGKTD